MHGASGLAVGGEGSRPRALWRYWACKGLSGWMDSQLQHVHGRQGLGASPGLRGVPESALTWKSPGEPFQLDSMELFKMRRGRKGNPVSNPSPDVHNEVSTVKGLRSPIARETV